jgi:hypothetical protein
MIVVILVLPPVYVILDDFGLTTLARDKRDEEAAAKTGANAA